MRRTCLIRFALVAAALLLSLQAVALSEEDQKCLACHAQEGMSKTFEKGDSVSLKVDGAAFAKSIHAPIGCAACHGDIDLKNHPGGGRKFATAREFSLAQAQACRQCHDDAFKQHEGSVHAKHIAEGNVLAPTCTGCHGAHEVSPKSAYDTCVGCHSAALGAHRQWLPNTAQHHETVSCAACHAPAALRMIDLRLYDSASKAWVAEKAGAPWFAKLARSVDTQGDGLDAVELGKLMEAIKRDAGAAPRSLRGRVELRANVEAHRLADRSHAIKACDSCHHDGAEPFRNVTVSVTAPDGRPVRYPAQAQVLGSALAVASLPEFYAIGGTRSALLDVLFLLALAGAIAFPLGHLSLRWLFRRLRR